VIVTVALVLLLIAAVLLARGESADPDKVWDTYLGGDLEGAERALGSLARRFSGGRLVQAAMSNPSTFEAVQRDISLGRSFNGSLEVYLSVQLVALLAGTTAASMAFLETEFVPYQPFLLVAFGAVVAYWPYNQVREKARERAQEVLDHLPRFADLLLMVLSSMSVPQALEFTANRDHGPVAAEMRELVRTLSMRAMPEHEAFQATAERMGTQQGRDFVETLASSYLEGTTSVSNITAQVEGLRTAKFQDQRATAKRIPVKLVVTFTLHFLPLLLVLSFMPILFAMGDL